MQTGWLTRADSYRVEKHRCPQTAGTVNVNAPATGVLHTTEGSLESALTVFEQHYAPHFLVGVDHAGKPRILQLLPLGAAAAALEHRPGTQETNTVVRVQVELVGHSKTAPWLPDPKTLDVLAALLATVATAADIPLKRPYIDAMPPQPWAVATFARRHDGKFGHQAGWFGHVEVPGNDHWDPGALRWSTVLAAARKKLPPPIVRVDIAKDGKPWLTGQNVESDALWKRLRATAATARTLTIRRRTP